MTSQQEENLSDMIAAVETITVVTDPAPGHIEVGARLAMMWRAFAAKLMPRITTLATEAKQFEPERSASGKIIRYKITDQQSYDRAADLLTSIKGERLDVNRLKAIPNKFHKLKTENLEQWNAFNDPLEESEALLKRELNAFEYRIEQQEAADRAAAEARAREENQRKADKLAAEAKKAGATHAEVAEIKESAAFMPVPAPPARVERAAGQSTSDNWKGDVQDFQKLVCYIVTGNADYKIKHPEFLGLLEPKKLAADGGHPAINQQVKATKDKTNIPGIKVTNDKTRRASSF
jgi:hypothetical protein